MSDNDGQNIVAGRIRQQQMVKTPDCLLAASADIGHRQAGRKRNQSRKALAKRRKQKEAQ